ncbi:MAG TPA: response regulator [Pyrinomonadaceae bacterium]|nr:response regulator [Pyrinomonadaceae bacterium]
MKNSLDPVKVLVIGTDFERLSEMFETFDRAGFVLSFASGGREGLRAMRMERPDMVLCEMGLHDMTGLDVCRTIREEPPLADVCFVMIAKSYHNTRNLLDAMAAGADDCLTERSLLTHLVAKIVWMVSRRRLERKQTAAFAIHRSRQSQLAGLLRDAASMLEEIVPHAEGPNAAHLAAPDLFASLAGLLDEQVSVLEKLGDKPPGYAGTPTAGDTTPQELSLTM